MPPPPQSRVHAEITPRFNMAGFASFIMISANLPPPFRTYHDFAEIACEHSMLAPSREIMMTRRISLLNTGAAHRCLARFKRFNGARLRFFEMKRR